MESRPDGARRRPGGRARPDEPTPQPRERSDPRRRAEGQPVDPPPRRRRRPPGADPRTAGDPSPGRRRVPRDQQGPAERTGRPVQSGPRGKSDRGQQQGRAQQPRRGRQPGRTQAGRAQAGSVQESSRPQQPRRRPPTDAPDNGRRSSGEIHTGDGSPRRRRRSTRDETGTVAATRPRGPKATGPEGRRGQARPTAPGGDSPAAPSPDTAARSTAPAGLAGRLGRRPKTSRAGIGRGLVAFLSVAVLLCTGYAWNNVKNLNSNITQLGGLELGGANDGAVDILLVGTDSRTDAKGNPLSPQELKLLRSGDEVATNTDTILLIRIPNDGSSATAISIPRDSYVDVPGIGMSKINAAYGTTKEGVREREVESGADEKKAEKDGTQAGRRALIDTVANLTGVKVDHYAEVGLLGFVLLTNAVGGVDVCLKEPVREPYSGARFKQGQQTLNGPKALSFVRQRHGLPRGDLDRITRQQVFMASLTQKMLSADLLADPGKLSELQRAVSRSVVIDDNWDVIKFAEQLKDLSGGRVKFATIPVVTEQGWSEDGQQSVVEVDPKQVHSFTDNLLNSKKNPEAVERGDYTVDVVNAGTIDGLASNVANILTNKGFQAGKTASGKADDRNSVVYTHSDDDGARQLAKDLGGAEVRVDSSLPDKRLKAVLTNTYEGPGSIVDTGTQVDNTPASERVGNNRPPITAGTDGPTCVN